MGILSIMAPALVLCLVLVGIHSYLGLHVIKRKVIFVDLALAQIAALGGTVGFLFGMDPGSTASFIFSIAFTFTGAAVFALTRARTEAVPQEAVIGLVYALAAAVAILVIDKSPHGAEHIKDLMTGNILWVRWSEVGSCAAVYALVGALHFVLRRRFILISEDPVRAFESGIRVRLWDFLFYLSFGLVITFSVHTAGVLLVFVFLVAPAITAVLLSARWLSQLLIGWGMGTVVTVAALALSYFLDLPAGPAVVAFYGVVLCLVAVAAFVARAKRRSGALARVGVGLGVGLAVLASLWILGVTLGGSSLARDRAHRESARSHEQDRRGVEQRVAPPASRPALDPVERIERLRREPAPGTTGARVDLVEAVIDPELPLLFRSQALELLRARAGTDFGYDPEREDNAEAIEKLRRWARSGRATP